MVKKVKSNQKIAKDSSNKIFKPVYLKFNFSFITYDENFTDKYQVQFIKRMREWSEVTYLELASWPKNRGFEIEKIKIDKAISSKFFDSNTHRRVDDGKFAIFRLYPNDNPIIARIIGKIINNVFYIFFIDIGGKLYNH